MRRDSQGVGYVALLYVSPVLEGGQRKPAVPTHDGLVRLGGISEVLAAGM